MSDLIERQAAIDALDGEIQITGRKNAEAVKGYVRLVKDRLEWLPSAEPEIIACGNGELVQENNELVQAGSSDLISRQAAIDLIEDIETKRLKGEVGLMYAPAIKGLRNLPPAQPEITHCKNCKHHQDEEPGMVYCPGVIGGWVGEDWHCADGERKEDG